MLLLMVRSGDTVCLMSIVHQEPQPAQAFHDVGVCKLDNAGPALSLMDSGIGTLRAAVGERDAGGGGICPPQSDSVRLGGPTGGGIDRFGISGAAAAAATTSSNRFDGEISLAIGVMTRLPTCIIRSYRAICIVAFCRLTASCSWSRSSCSFRISGSAVGRGGGKNGATPSAAAPSTLCAVGSTGGM
eukprot:COSAG01_NODE_517_length_16020_cov_42.983167_11_plen_187_part_00